MAKKRVFIVTDDISGEVIPQGEGETIRFSYRGKDYSIDLNAENARSFYESLEPYTSAASRVSRKQRSGRTDVVRSTAKSDNKMTQMSLSGEQAKAVRDWCNNNGIPVSPLGRISAAAKQAFDAAH